MKHQRAIIRQLQKIKAKLSPLPSDNFWKFMQRSPLKGICLSLTRNKDFLRDIESYRGFLFVKDAIGDTKRETKFKREVDSFFNTVVKHYDELRNQDYQLSAEIRAQAILMKVMPDYKVIRVDDGSASSQIDLKAVNISKKHTIAIEATQYIINNYDKIKSNEQGIYRSDCIKREWILHVNNTTAAEIKSRDIQRKIVPILVKIESKFTGNNPIEIYTSGLYSEDLSLYTKMEINDEIETLSNLNITRVYSEELLVDQGTDNGTHSIQICIGENYSPTTDKDEMLKKILEVAFNECKKKDNQKKLHNCSMNEKHLFIIITFAYEKIQYFEKLVDHLDFPGNTISIHEKDVLEQYSTISNIADVVWIEYATYDATGKVVSSLIKIIHKEDKFIFSLICNKEPYIKEVKNENSLCRL